MNRVPSPVPPLLAHMRPPCTSTIPLRIAMRHEALAQFSSILGFDDSRGLAVDFMVRGVERETLHESNSIDADRAEAPENPRPVRRVPED